MRARWLPGGPPSRPRAVLAALLLVACARDPREGAAPIPAAPGPLAPTAAPSPPPPPSPPAPPAESITVAFTGDIMFGRFTERGFRAIPAERMSPFAAVAPLLASDLTLANLETPVIAVPPATSRWGTSMRFVTTPARIATLAPAGIDAVTIANNHFFDMRDAGVAETPVLVAAAGLHVIGAARGPTEDLFRIESVTTAGWSIALIAAATVSNTDNPDAPRLPYAESHRIGDALAPIVMAARANHDVVIVAVHWGVEYDDAPQPWQIRAAHQWIDAGADAVVGHHPHVLQAIERYQRGVIAYSLGNFLFDNDWRTKRDAGVLRVTFRVPSGVIPPKPACIADVRFLPTVIELGAPAYRTMPAASVHGTARVGIRLRELSRARHTSWQRVGSDFVAPPVCLSPAGQPGAS